MRQILSEEFGKIEIRTVPLPEGVNPGFATYTPSGRVAIQYTLPSDPKGYAHIITQEDDGTDVCEIFYGDITPIYRSNGFRYMPFNDNKRAYIGDWILECEPDCDHAVSSRLVPIHYPDELVNTKGLWMVWSENVVSPDGKTIAFSALGATGNVYVADLRREKDCYELDNVRGVGTLVSNTPDPKHEGFVLPQPIRGGEVKQFVRGGLGLTYVGTGRGPGNSMYQALDSDDVEALSLTPGYDETCMVSPDERLGGVMSSRFSPASNLAILGLIPRRANLEVKSCLAMSAYLYAVADVRSFRTGCNIGPALVSIERAKKDLNYLGVNLSDPDDHWVFSSPLSWHPNGKTLMWNEILRGSFERQIMIAHLAQYVPGPLPEIVPVPKKIPYATDGILKTVPEKHYPVRIAGLSSGSAVTSMHMKDGTAEPVFTTTYENFSDDGETFLSGYESANNPGLTSAKDIHYQADLTMTGSHTGRMELSMTFHRDSFSAPVEITPDSKGYAAYDGQTINL